MVVFGTKPPAQTLAVKDFEKRIIARGSQVVVLNEDAHYKHDEDSKWNKTIWRLHASLVAQVSKPAELPTSKSGGCAKAEASLETRDTADSEVCATGIVAKLDLTATPRHSKGQLLSWTVYDYPLKQAIIDNVVKRPLKGIAKNITEQRFDIASTRYRAYLAAGVKRWKKYREQLKPHNKKPVLFVMMNDTAKADEVGDWLRRHIQTSLEVRGGCWSSTPTKRVKCPRKIWTRHARQRGSGPRNQPDQMHRQRAGPAQRLGRAECNRDRRPAAYTSKANIQPEQTVGRGLRLMFRGMRRGYYTEYVDVIDNKTFIEFAE